MSPVLLSLLLLLSCRDKDTATLDSDPGTLTTETHDTADTDTPPTDTATEPVDADGDGHPLPDDCDDADAAISPDATELCDGVDNDCDETVDEDDAADAEAWYPDDDGDGYGRTDDEVVACDAPRAHAAHDGDCDDDDPRTHPGAPEDDCTDGHDYNCDGSVGYADEDGDLVPACEDCDDADPFSFPDAPETCDGADDDCDGTVDEDAIDATTFYGDADGDGHGGTTFATAACEAPSGYVDVDDDCDDLDPTSFPGGTEVCDGADNDCSGDADEGVLTTWYLDADADGHGDPDSTTDACDWPGGYAAAGDDCDDGDPSAWPGATETCDTVDNDCDGDTDEGLSSTWYADDDGDGYGDPDVSTDACAWPADHASNDDDCDDTDPSAHPGGLELCDGADNDCDGSADDGALDADDWYLDQDGDGFGDADAAVAACDAPSASYVEDDADCDDTDSAVNPDAAELCNGTDDDCDGDVDTDATDATSWYADTDGDGYGDPDDAVASCDAVSGTVEDDGDCDDGDGAVHPGASDACDAVDNDCDGSVDEDATAITWYADSDGDGYGDPDDSTEDCATLSGYSEDGTDCDDGDAAVNPGATEICDGVDGNCDDSDDEAVGTAETCPAADCDEVQTVDSGASDGAYWVDPDGTGAFEVTCDFSSSGGPWAWTQYDDLQAYWDFDDSDLSRDAWAGYTGSIEGSTTQTTHLAGTDFGYSVHFDNDEADRIDMSSGPTLGSTSTIVFWAENDSCSNNQIALCFSDGSSYMADLYYPISLSASGASFKTSVSGWCSETMGWHHYAYVDDGSAIRVWMDGGEVSADSYSYQSLSGLSLTYLGGRPGFGTNGLSGYMDDLAVFERALTEAELQALYDQGAAGHPMRWQ